jgi:L-galactono-1,4-lactone dehydrogenase
MNHSKLKWVAAGVGASIGLATLGGGSMLFQSMYEERNEKETRCNWSMTHQCKARRVHSASTTDDLVQLFRDAAKQKWKIRAIGSGLSPNALGFCDDGQRLASVADMDKLVCVDAEQKIAVAGAGMTVGALVEALREHNLTLKNVASIDGQQLGGFTQVGAHGSGARIAPADQHVCALEMVTPSRGCVRLAASDEDARVDLVFRVARLALGSLGVVTELAIECCDAHRLRERTYVMRREHIRERHAELLRANRHVRYMWIPYVDAVVVVVANQVDDEDDESEDGEQAQSIEASAADAQARLLLAELGGPVPGEHASFADVRDALLDVAPLDVAHVRRVNEAEADYWRRSAGTRVDDSDRILQFDCGGQQWVNEVAFECGTIDEPSTADIDYMLELLELIESSGVPAPAPIEQRWSAASQSPLSPAYSTTPGAIFSWVGIIMYLPPLADEPRVVGRRQQLADAFASYRNACAEHLWPKYGAKQHWAKLEPDTPHIDKLIAEQYASSLPLFQALRQRFDKNSTLANRWFQRVFPL